MHKVLQSLWATAPCSSYSPSFCASLQRDFLSLVHYFILAKLMQKEKKKETKEGILRGLLATEM